MKFTLKVLISIFLLIFNIPYIAHANIPHPIFSEKKLQHKQENYLITPSAGKGGEISPATPTSVEAGTTIIIKAIPNKGYKVNQWFVDNTPVGNIGDTSYMLANIQSDHSIKVNFIRSNIFIMTGYSKESSNSFLMTSINGGDTWESKSIQNISNTDSKIFNTASCSRGRDPICVIAGQVNTRPLIAISLDNADTWQAHEIENLSASGKFFSASCSGVDKAVCAITGKANSENDETSIIVTTTDKGHSWQ